MRQPDLEESYRQYEVATTNMGAAFQSLRVIHAHGTHAEIAQARDLFVMWAEATADRWLEHMDDQLQVKGICPVRRQRYK